MKRSPLLAFTLLTLILTACGAGSEKSSAQDLVFDLVSPEANSCLSGLSLDYLDQSNVESHDHPQQFIQETYPVDETYCANPVLEATTAALESFDQLLAEKKAAEALALIAEYVEQLTAEYLAAGSAGHLAAPASVHDGGRTRVYMRQMFTIAERLYKQGYNDEADEYVQKATDAYEKYGYEELALIEDDFKAALAIAAEAMLLGLTELGDDALDKAREIVEEKLNKALDAFQPCTSTESDVDYVDEMFIWGQLLGAESANERTYEFYDGKLPEWKTVQEKRSRGESIEGCDLNAVLIENSIAGVFDYRGEAYTCDGENWSVEVVVSANIDSAVLFVEGAGEFTLVDGSGSSEIPTQGTITDGDDSASLAVPLSFSFTLSEDKQSAEIGIGSQSPDGLLIAGDFTSVFALPGGFFTVPLTVRECGN